MEQVAKQLSPRYNLHYAGDLFSHDILQSQRSEVNTTIAILAGQDGYLLHVMRCDESVTSSMCKRAPHLEECRPLCRHVCTKPDRRLPRDEMYGLVSRDLMDPEVEIWYGAKYI